MGRERDVGIKERDAVGNAGFVVGEDSVLVVDSFATPAAAQPGRQE